MKLAWTKAYAVKRFSRLLALGILLAVFASATYALSPAAHKSAHADTGCVESNAATYYVTQDDPDNAWWDNNPSADLWPCISNGPSTVNTDAYVSFNGQISYSNPDYATWPECRLWVRLYKVGMDNAVDEKAYDCTYDFTSNSRGLHYNGPADSYQWLIDSYGHGAYWTGVEVNVTWYGNTGSEGSTPFYSVDTYTYGTTGDAI